MDADLGTQEDRAAQAGRLGSRLLAGSLAATAVSVPLTVLTAVALSRSGTLRDWDVAVVDAIHSQVVIRPRLADLLGWLSVATHPNTVRLVTAVIVIVLWLRRRRRRALWLASAVTLGSLLSPLLKEVVGRSRPVFEHPVALAPGYSFPSGHALNSMVLAACAVILTHGATRGRPLRRTAVCTLAVLFVLVTGLDRIGLGVHYTTDVVAGWLVGLASTAITTAAFESWRRREGLPPSTTERGLDPDPGDGLTPASPTGVPDD